MDSEPIEGLLDDDIVSIGRLAFEPLTAIGPYELADGQGEAIGQGDLPI